MNHISWITPISFIDVDILIVPELSKTFKIDWTIVGGNKPPIYSKIKSMESKNLHVGFYAIKSKWYMPTSCFEYWRLFRTMANSGSDLIYVDMAPQLYAYYAAKCTLPKQKVIFATHNVKTPKGARLEEVARFYMKKLLNNYQNFQVFSRNQQAYLESMVQGKNVLYAPLALKQYGDKEKRTKHQGKMNFLSFGHIRHYKRIDLLIDAAQMLYEETGEKFVVTIAGNCPSWGEYAGRIKYPELFDLQIGFVDDNAVAGLFANADYLILPYQDLAQSGAITVAFNYGVPVITSDIPQFQEFVEEGRNGYMFKSEDARALKDVMKKALLQSKEKYTSLVASTEQYVKENYSLEAIVQRYINYFNSFR